MANVTRRALLIDGSRVAATLAFPWKSSQPATGPSLAQTAGIQLYTVMKELQEDLQGTLKKLSAIGYRAVESAGFAGRTAPEFRKALDDAGLHCPSSHLFLAPGQSTEEFLATVKTVGSEYVVTSVVILPGANVRSGVDAAKYIDSLTLDDYKKMIDSIHALALQAKDAGLKLAYHNHNAEFRRWPNGQMGLGTLMAGLDPALVKIELDCGWADLAGYSPVRIIEEQAGRVRMLHVKDFRPVARPVTTLAEETRPEWTLLGKGHIDYAVVLRVARKNGVEQVFIEQEPPYRGFTALEAAKANLDYLHSIG